MDKTARRAVPQNGRNATPRPGLEQMHAFPASYGSVTPMAPETQAVLGLSSEPLTDVQASPVAPLPAVQNPAPSPLATIAPPSAMTREQRMNRIAADPDYWGVRHQPKQRPLGYGLQQPMSLRIE